jgi:tRNA(Ile)-lysidine synthase
MEGKAVVERFAAQRGLKLVTSSITREKDPKESPQEYWRNERYAFLRKFDMPVVVAHTLDDVLETWIFSATHGTPSLMQYQAGNVIRPFLYCDKNDLREWCERKGVEWAEDTSNLDVTYPRNRIRHKVLPELLAINPGLKKVMRKKLLKRTAL